MRISIEADLIVLVGSNAAWCHPVLFQRMVKNRRERGAQDRGHRSAPHRDREEADLFLPIAPGMDIALFAGCWRILPTPMRSTRAISPRTPTGFDAALARRRANRAGLDAVAATTGLAAADVAQFFELFRATTECRSPAIRKGVNQSAQGTDKVNAIINCHLATGRIGKPGMGPSRSPASPMRWAGARSAASPISSPRIWAFAPAKSTACGRFWHAPRMAQREGLKAVQMFEAIAARRDQGAVGHGDQSGRVAAGRADAVRDGAWTSSNCSSSPKTCCRTTRWRAARMCCCPPRPGARRSGTVTNSERRISRQRAFLPLPGEARPDWWIVAEVARRLGFADAFGYRIGRRCFPRTCRAVGLRE